MQQHVVGVLGGGQLGRMLVEAAHRLNIKVVILDAPNSPAKQISAAQHVDGSFKNAADVRKLKSMCNVITYEIEHVDTKVLEELEAEQATIPGTDWSIIQPHFRTVREIQDKFQQKRHLENHGIPVAESKAVVTFHPQGLKDIADTLGGFPLMLKTRRDAYDGRGNYPLRSVSDLEPALSTMKGDLYVERWANFKMELAVMVVKTDQAATRGEHQWQAITHAYPVTETVHEDSICKLTYTPARGVSRAVQREAQSLARRAVASFRGAGVFGVEMFLLENVELVVNEIAPRPHNSGHYTIEACQMSQFHAHLRAILPDLHNKIPFAATDLRTPDTNAIMLNILGGPTKDSHLLVANAALEVPEAAIHLYSKGDGRPGRKMGHITVIGRTMEDAEIDIQPLVNWVDAIRAHKHDEADGSASAISETAARLTKERGAPRKRKPLIGVTMGSDSDLSVLTPGLAILDEVNIPYEVTITSAHRTPDRMLDYARTAEDRGLKCIIAAAGGAAHLPGMLAAATTLPVIGVPVKGSTMDGMDSLLSIVQMPRGVPVATMAVNNSTNAALMAWRIIGTGDESMRERMGEYMKHVENMVLEKAKKLESVGYNAYLAEK